MNRSELETKSRKQLLALAERAGISIRQGLGKAGLVELLLSAPSGTPRPETPAELPSSYGRTRLTLVEIEPHWIHAYWEITAPDCEAARAAAGPEAAQAAWVLRFHDVTDAGLGGANASGSFDVPVDVGVGNWYVNLWSGGKSYCAEIGLRAPGGSFLPVSRSGVVQVPAAAASPQSETEWMKVEPVSGAIAPAQEPPAEEAPAPVMTTADEAIAPQAPVVGTLLLPAAEQPASHGAAAAEADAAVAAEDIVISESARAAIPEKFSWPPSTRAGSDAATVLPEATATDRWCAEILSPESGNNGSNGNGHAEPALEPPASQESPAVERETEPSSHSVDRFGTTSGGLGAGAEPAPSIKLELNAEVVIYGRAMPGQTVEVCGRSVKVNPDGTFSVRMALPLAGDDATRGQ